ncbi:serine protease [Candidatus Wolfebacteria bacterium]|nr:serine protease [Candidatus Wolfebacteria bacterium]
MSGRGNITFIVIVVLAATATLVVAGSKISASFAELSETVVTLASRVGILEERLSTVFADAEALRATLSEEQQTRLAQEEARQAAEKEIAARLEVLSTDVSDQSSILKAGDLAAVIARWRPYVYKLACTFRQGAATEETSGGSAIVETNGNVTRFVTNEHVLEDGGSYPDSCRLLVPGTDTDIAVDGDGMTIEPEQDIGYGTIAESGVTGILPVQHCAAKPEIGDAVVILGYPAIGGDESITATEGIISGFDEEYYITSAKIEKGNSGGAAIDVKRDCLLGLPTLVVAGRIESLARILPITSFE